VTALTLAALTMAGTAAAQSRPAGPARSATAPGSTTAAKPPKSPQPVTVDADKMERFGKERLVIFTGKVVARQDNNVQYADRMEVYFDEKEDRILRTVSTGNVRIITSDCRTGTARRAEYYDLEQRVVLLGNARVWQEDNVVSGETITIYISQDRSVVEAGKQERVKGIFFPRGDNNQPSASAAARPPGPACAN
jgi:lipopolysaccharide export system protein LptA